MLHYLKLIKIKLFSEKSRDIIYSLSLFFIFSLFFGSFMLLKENLSIIDTLYFLITTATTVGYGDISPKSDIGKIISIFYMIFSISILGIFLSAIAESIIESINKKKKGLKKMRKNIKLIIIGYPSEDKVKEIVDELKKEDSFKKANIVLISNNIKEKPIWFEKYSLEFIYGLGSNVEILNKANIKTAEIVLVLANDPKKIESDDFTSSAVAVVHKINPNVRIISEKVRKDNILFEAIGCDTITRVSSPELLAQEILDPGAVEFNQAIFSNDTEGTQYNYKYTGDTVLWKDIVIMFMEAGGIAEGLKKKDTFNFLPNINEKIKSGYIIKYRSNKRILELSNPN
jgi:voltage-gated potassium channel